MLTMDEARARVAKGAALLDERVPDWLERIDTSKLSLLSPCLCVIGQVFGNYYLNVRRFMGVDETEHQAHGFWLIVTNLTEKKLIDADYRVLQDAWLEAITERTLPLVPIRKTLPESVLQA